MLKAGGFALALMGLGLAGHLKARDSYGAMPSLSGASQWLNSPPVDAPGPVSYTHLTLPTSDLV